MAVHLKFRLQFFSRRKDNIFKEYLSKFLPFLKTVLRANWLKPLSDFESQNHSFYLKFYTILVKLFMIFIICRWRSWTWRWWSWSWPWFNIFPTIKLYTFLSLTFINKRQEPEDVPARSQITNSTKFIMCYINGLPTKDVTLSTVAQF